MQFSTITRSNGGKTERRRHEKIPDRMPDRCRRHRGGRHRLHPPHRPKGEPQMGLLRFSWRLIKFCLAVLFLLWAARILTGWPQNKKTGTFRRFECRPACRSFHRNLRKYRWRWIRRQRPGVLPPGLFVYPLIPRSSHRSPPRARYVRRGSFRPLPVPG